MKPTTSLAAVIMSAFILAGCSTSSPTLDTSRPAPGEPTLAEVRTLTSRFQDVNIALAEGYVRDPMNMCDTAAGMGQPAARGAMGIHFFRPDMLGVSGPPDPRVDGTGVHTDFRTPAILIYEPQADGSLELVAVENLVFQKAWHATGAVRPPTFHGVVWDTMRDDPKTAIDEAHMFEPHYDRHVWIWRDNPNGVFTPFNPAVTCQHHRETAPHAAHAALEPSLQPSPDAPQMMHHHH